MSLASVFPIFTDMLKKTARAGGVKQDASRMQQPGDIYEGRVDGPREREAEARHS